jgi:hypothetical protein
MPLMTATGVASRRKPGSRTPRSLSVPRTKPWSARMNFQLIVRMMKLVKNGMITSRSRMFLYRPPRKAMVYAIG